MDVWIKIGKNSLIYGIGAIIPQATGFLLLPVYTRYLTPSDYGILAMLALIATPLTMLLGLRLNTAVMRFLFDYEGEERKVYLGTIFLFLLVYSLPICLSLIFLGQPLFEKLFKSGDIPFYPLIVWQIIILYLSLAWFSLSPIFKAEGKARQWLTLSLVSFVLQTALILYFIIVQKEGVVGLVKGMLIANAIMFLVSTIVLSKRISFKLSWHKLKESLIFCTPLLPSALSLYILGFTDRWFLERYWSLAEVGLFSIALHFGHLLGLIYAASGDAWMPVFYGTANKDERQAKGLLVRAVTLWAVGGGFIALVLAFFSREVLLVMTTPEFHPAYVIVPILVFNGLIMGIRFYPRYGLLFAKKTKAILMITSAAAGVNVLANFILVPRYGMFGAAYATLIANVVAALITYLVVQRYYPLKFEYAKLAKVLGMVLVLLVLVNFLSREILYFDIPLKIAALVIYSIGILYLGIIDKNQLVKLKDNFNLKALLRLWKE